MVAQLIWIAAVYASAVLVVHVLHFLEQARQAPRPEKWIHYVLITRNHESVIEWYIRALSLHAFLTGKRLRVTCMDDRSSDDTLRMVNTMKQGGCCLEVETDIGYDESRYGISHAQTACADHTEATGSVMEQRHGSSWMTQEIIIDLRLPEMLVPLSCMQDLGSRGYGSKHG